MHKEDFAVVIDETREKTDDLLTKKNAEYAGDVDVLANFKRNAKHQGVTALEIWHNYWAKHVDSINSYVHRVRQEALKMALRRIVERARGPVLTNVGDLIDPINFQALIDEALPAAITLIDGSLSEPIEGRFHDNINYSILFKALISDLREGKL